MAECEKVCKYIDLPLQHASNRCSKRMKRPGTRQTYDRLLDRIRDARARRRAPHDVHRRVSRARPRPTSTSSARSSATTRFDHVGVFTYSHEEGTSALRADRRRARPRRRRRAGNRVMSLQKRLVRRRQRGADRRAGPGARRRALRRPRAGAARRGCRPRRPTSTPSVYLTECDPSALPRRRLRRGRDRRAREDYDLICPARSGSIRCAIILCSEPGCRTEVGVCPLF